MKRNKKGFTIIELVVVIAVIAILAAVLIPTFSSIIKKANTSADIQAVNTMNKYLAIEEVTGNKTIVDVYDALKEGGMTAKDYHPLTSNTYFFWDSALNRIVYTDDTYTVIYPDEYKGNKFASANKWYSLSGEINAEEVKPTTSTSNNQTTIKYEVTSAEQLYWVAEQFNSSKTNNDKIIEVSITATEINLMGASVNFYVNANCKGFSLTGANDGTTITGLAQLEKNETWWGADFDCGLISKLYVNNNSYTNTIKNITIKDSAVGNYSTGCCGGLIGEVIGEITNVEIDNCHVVNTVVLGDHHIGGLIGQIQQSKVDIKNCTLKSVDVNCTIWLGGKCIGTIFNVARVTLDKKFSEWVDNNCTLNLVKGNTNYAWYTLDEYKTINSNDTPITDTTTVVKINDSYYAFSDKAYATIRYVTYKTNSYGTSIKYGNNNDYYLNITEEPSTSNTTIKCPYSFIIE